LDLSSLYLTINEMIEANLKANASENIKEAKKPEIVLLI
jgi:hypothetical protein